MLLPGLILVLVFAYLPMGGMIMAFQNFKPWLGFVKSPWVGLEHFRFMFEREDSILVIRNTFVISSLKMVFGLAAAVTLALLLNEVRRSAFKRTVQTLVYMPHFLSWVILGGVLTDMLSPKGLINGALAWFGIEPIFFLGNNDWFLFTVVVSDIWKEVGFSAIVFLAALAGINPSLYEAALIDGANRWRQTVNITLPSMVPIIVVVATLSLGNILNAGFDQIFNLYNHLVYERGDIIDTFVYRMAIQSGQLSFATAVGLFKSVIGFTLIVTSYRLAYKYANYRIF